MSAKFLHAFGEENPDLSRQIGCMTGIFQMFDKQYLLTSGRRRLPAPKQLPSGPALSNSSSVSAERVICSPQIVLEKNLSKSWKETRRASLESSNSFSSSSSSFSSLDCNHSTNHDLPPLDRILFPEMPLKNSAKLRVPDSDASSIDIRDFVKDAINRETRGGLSFKSSTREGRRENNRNYYRDSPRPMQLPKKGTVISELDESFNALVKLEEASRRPILEPNQTPRFSFDARDQLSRSLTRDAPRFSLDNHNPRLSLDSKDAASLWNDSNSDSNLNSNSVAKGEKIGIVAKLMGLEAMPKSNSGDREMVAPFKDGKISNPKIYCRDEKMPKLPKMQEKRRTKVPDLSMKPMSSSRISTEQQVSVYSEMEKRLKDLEFEQSNRDLRALKQILDSMQAKGLLEPEKTETISNSSSQSKQHAKSNKEIASTRDFKLPIVIMKPMKSILGTVEDVPLDPGNKKKSPVNNRVFKEQPGKAGARVSPSKRPENKRNEENNIKQKSGSTSPRLQQKRLEMEKRSSKPPILNSNSNSNSNKSSKQHAGRNSLDSTSPRNRIRRKPAQTEKSDKVSSDVSACQNSDEVSLRSDSSISMTSSKFVVEVTSRDKSGDVKHISSPQREYQNSDVKSPLDYSNVEITGCVPAPITPEQPSPVSVLDTSLYHEDVPPPSTRSPILSREKKLPAKSKKMENIENLLQKLKQLSQSETDTEEAGRPATDHIVLLCETADPDHRYVSEILLASGLLMKDLLEVQLHASGNPVNPDLFLVLERVKSDPEKTHRKLVFDLVNELLLQKMDFKTVVKSINRHVPFGGQKLLREICADIEELKREKGGSSEDESNVLSGKDMMKGSDGWAHFGREVSGIVLDVERSIFKELIDEVVTGEVLHGSKAKGNNRRRRKLFVK